MNSRGPLALLLFALALLLLGITIHQQPVQAFIRTTPAGQWIFPSLLTVVGLAAVLFAWAWRQSLVRARQEGESVRESELRQRKLVTALDAQQEQWQRALFDSNPLVMLLVDPANGRIIDANESAERFYGYSRETLREMSIGQINLLRADLLKENLQRALNEGPLELALRHRLADGTMRDVSVITGPLLSDGRELLFSIIQDVTLHRRAEESFRRIVDTSPAGFHIYQLDKDNRLIFTASNAAADKIIGIEHAALVGKPIEEAFPGPELKTVAECYRGIAEGGGNWSIENFAYDFDGVSGSFDVTAFQVAPGQVAVMFVDATERYRHEQALTRSERRFRQLYERSPVGIAMATMKTGRIFSANPACARILGISEQALQAHRIETLKTPEGEAPLPDELFTPERVRTMQRQFLRPDGTVVWAELTFCCVSADDDLGVAGMVIIQDVTERRRAEEQLREAKRAAERASAAKDQFLAALSHELRTPLTPVLLTTQSLQMDDNLPPSAREDLLTIQRNVELEARLIDDLLDLTRIVRGKMPLNRVPINLHDCIRSAVEICRPEAHKKGIRLDVWFEARRAIVDGDSSRLQQVFWNLIKNAIKFTPQRGLVVVRTRNDRLTEDENDAPRVLCEVVDNGLGMEPEVLDRIFIPFEQGSTRVTKLFGGLGMGLSISKAIVDMHGGTITAYSMGPGTGAVFTVVLDTTSQPALAPQSSDAPRRFSERAMTVLLVEDHEATARVLTRLLARCGYRVLMAADVAGAMELARHESFDLLISDLGLPDGSGLDLVKQIKQLRAVPAIAVSGYGMEQDIRNSIEAGFQEHLTKPVNVDTLRHSIDRVMAGSIHVG